MGLGGGGGVFSSSSCGGFGGGWGCCVGGFCWAAWGVGGDDGWLDVGGIFMIRKRFIAGSIESRRVE